MTHEDIFKDKIRVGHNLNRNVAMIIASINNKKKWMLSMEPGVTKHSNHPRGIINVTPNDYPLKMHMTTS